VQCASTVTKLRSNTGHMFILSSQQARVCIVYATAKSSSVGYYVCESNNYPVDSVVFISVAAYFNLACVDRVLLC